MMPAVEQESCVVDGFGPLPVQQVESVAEVCDLVRQAAAQEQALYPLGGRTQLFLGLPPRRPGWGVDLCRLCRVIDYPARDLTITVQTGIRLAALQNILAAEGQRLPLEVPQAERATLGGALATATSGPRRYGWGSWRDYVLGMHAVNDRGEEFKAGGRVVKNVAGYDLCKLYIGALGTLGILTQVTLKLLPVPEEQALVLLCCPAAELGEVLERLHTSRTRPVCLEVLNPAASRLCQAQGVALPDASWLVVVGYEGLRETVAWQVQQLIRECGARWPLEVRVGEAARPLEQALTEFPGWAPGPLTLKVVLRPSSGAALCQQVERWPLEIALAAHAGNGIFFLHVLASELTPQQASELVQRARQEVAAGHGHVTVYRCPSTWKDHLDIWGPLPPVAALWRALKHQFDPRGIFNPGRFVAGL
jgi:glycolate oxidase FAD binding subunit